MQKLASIIVTYNNASMIKDVLEDIFNQSMKSDEVIVMDNSSNNLTEKIIEKNYQGITYIKMTENVGSAGGYHEGIKIAIKNCDLILTLDDDVEMMENSVEELVNGLKSLEKENGHMIGAVRAVGMHQKYSIPTELNYFAWRGTLIKSDAIQEVGLPCKDYFIYADDIEYALRLAKRGYKFFWIPKSKIFEKRINDKSSHKIFGRKIVFYGEDFRFYYSFRNSLHVYKKYRRYRLLLKTLVYGIKISIFLFLVYQLKELNKLQAILRGILDGFCSNLGKNIKYSPK